MTDLADDFAKVREFIEHEREMRECCTDLPDYMCAPIHANATFSRIEAAYREAAKERDSVQTQLGNLLAVIHRDGGHTQAKIGTSLACAGAKIQVTKWLSADDTIADLRRQLAAAKASDADLRQELAELGHRVARLDAIGALKETL